MTDSNSRQDGISVRLRTPTTGSMHYEKAPLLQKVEAGMGAGSAPLRCAGASLRYGGAREQLHW
jgi:hypothetical protein